VQPLPYALVHGRASPAAYRAPLSRAYAHRPLRYVGPFANVTPSYSFQGTLLIGCRPFSAGNHRMGRFIRQRHGIDYLFRVGSLPTLSTAVAVIEVLAALLKGVGQVRLSYTTVGGYTFSGHHQPGQGMEKTCCR
jgi:hypothetical protein